MAQSKGSQFSRKTLRFQVSHRSFASGDNADADKSNKSKMERRRIRKKQEQEMARMKGDE